MKKFIVNNQEVEYLRIKEENDAIIVEYDEKFNLITAHMGVIMEKLRDNGLYGVLVFKDLKHHIISIWLDDINQVAGVLHSLHIPPLTYEVLYDDLILVVDTPLLEQSISQSEFIQNATKTDNSLVGV